MGSFSLCKLHQKVSTDCISYTNGFIMIPKYSNVLLISTDDAELLFSINNCPFCGEKINEKE